MHIAIIGNGISGVTAARFIRKLSNHRITLISAESDYFFSRTALMYIYMGHMRMEDTKPYEDWFWEKNKIDLKKGYVEQVLPAQKMIQFQGGEQLAYDKLVIACGSTPNKFGWPGQDLNRVHGLYSLQDLEAMEGASEGLKRAVIIGGGLIGIEMAEMFHSRHIPVTFLVREEKFWNMVLPTKESEMVTRHIRENGIDLRMETELKEIVDDGTGQACAVITNKGERIECGYVGLTAGVHPNIGFLKDSGIETQKGILVNHKLETNVSDIYAIGDCAQINDPLPGRRPIEAIWYTGRMMGQTVAQTICEKPTDYDPGIWFNSAKFFDIEYQIYGTVLAHPPEHHQQLYWEHPQEHKAIRIVYDQNDNSILGFHLMGIRYRHEVCEKWIKEKASIEEVLSNLGLANFDPEFYKTYESELIRLYNQLSGSQLQLKKRSSLNSVFKFLSRVKS